MLGRKRVPIDHVTIRVDEDEDVLRRAAKLNTALLKVLQGQKLIRVVKADYAIGCVEVLVEALDVNPPVTPACVTIDIKPWS